MAYMWYLQKHFKTIVLIISLQLTVPLYSQSVVTAFNADSLTDNEFAKLKEQYANNKKLPNGFEKQVVLALSYFPELVNVKITFKVTNKRTPLSTRPSFIGMFQNAKKRNYIITISKKSIAYLNPIILENLSYNSQIGVLGHELSHVSNFTTKGFGGMCKVMLGHLSKKYVDRFEFNTDLLCINHQLGYQLLAWSINVRSNLKITDWQGADHLSPTKKRERYMNPSTIVSILSTHPFYKK
jgi:hypothetical protein